MFVMFVFIQVNSSKTSTLTASLWAVAAYCGKTFSVSTKPWAKYNFTIMCSNVYTTPRKRVPSENVGMGLRLSVWAYIYFCSMSNALTMLETSQQEHQGRLRLGIHEFSRTLV